jgi:hypothetical protein
VQLSLTGLDGTPIYNVSAGNIEGVNKIDSVSPQNILNSSINLGLPIFEQYDIAFNLEEGIIGMRPIPEPHSVLLIVAAFGYLLIRKNAERNA